MQIREFEEKDFGRVAKLMEDFQDYLIALEPQKRMRRLPTYGESSLRKILEKIQEKEGSFYIAEENNQIVGFICGIIQKPSTENILSHFPSTSGWITDLYIDSEYRGNGAGGKLMAQIEKYFKEKHCDSVRLALFSSNFKAHNFYKNLGFENRTIEMIKKL